MAEFDRFSGTYRDHVDNAVRFSGLKAEFFYSIKVEKLISLVGEFLSPMSASVLDVGCGTGSLSKLVAPRVKELVGVDVSESSLETACREVPECSFVQYDGMQLPFPDGRFDLAFVSCVMHHVPPCQWSTFSKEVYRSIRPGGLVAIIEHNPWNPLTRVAVSRCEFDNDAVLLSRGSVKTLFESMGGIVRAAPFILFFPWRSTVFRQIEGWISGIPLGAQYIVLVQKPFFSVDPVPS